LRTDFTKARFVFDIQDSIRKRRAYHMAPFGDASPSRGQIFAEIRVALGSVR
jgi:hypothetical protein